MDKKLILITSSILKTEEEVSAVKVHQFSLIRMSHIRSKSQNIKTRNGIGSAHPWSLMLDPWNAEVSRTRSSEVDCGRILTILKRAGSDQEWILLLYTRAEAGVANKLISDTCNFSKIKTEVGVYQFFFKPGLTHGAIASKQRYWKELTHFVWSRKNTALYGKQKQQWLA